METALRFTEVGHAYDNQVALVDVSFHVTPGQILCLLGPSGCGKTTALRIAAGLERPQRGEVSIRGEVVSSPEHFVVPERRGVGLLFQDYALFPHLSVEDNVQFGLRRLPSEEQKGRCQHWLKRVGLWHRRRDYPHRLSGGEQQRIALARALAPRPAVLLLDEPFSNLDTRLRQQVRDEVMRAVKAIGAAALMVTHDPEEALYMGDQIALMDEGKILQQGTAEQLYYYPSHPAVANFFGDVNHITSRVQGRQALTPFGPISARDFKEEEVVDVHIRAEAISLAARQSAGELSCPAIVTDCRHLGRSSLIHVKTQPVTGFCSLLRLHALGMVSLAPGTEVWLGLDPTLAFVFPHDQSQRFARLEDGHPHFFEPPKVARAT